MQLNLKVKKVKPQAKLPIVAHVGEDFGYDVFACLDEWSVSYFPETDRWTVMKNDEKHEEFRFGSDAAIYVEDAKLHNYITISPGQQQRIPTGIAVAVDDFSFANVLRRDFEDDITYIDAYKVGLIAKQSSGLALKRALDVKSGVIDAGYRNELQILLYNYGNTVQFIKHHDKIGQLVPVPVFAGYVTEVDELPDSKRGMAGWGSNHTDVTTT